ncbi:MAG TPA: ester cyclase [Pyrinomonadaceae bacterium]|nr:ester cyclase [Pyrinomonadaceae bacterium]
MSEENKRLVQRWFDQVWNQGRVDAINEMFAADGLAYGLTDNPAEPIGPSGFRDLHTTFRGAFPDMTITVEEMIAEGDKVAARCSVRGKHQGDHLGFAATKAPVDFTGMTIVRIRDGKIVEAWNNFDFMRMNRQLGVF